VNYLADAERRANHWYERYQEERKKSRSLLAENKKAKERALAAARIALKYKESDRAITRIAEAADGAPSYVAFGEDVLKILEELGYEIT
jgi:hypothetical protein